MINSKQQREDIIVKLQEELSLTQSRLLRKKKLTIEAIQKMAKELSYRFEIKRSAMIQPVQ